jgi:DNA-binding response OmpR family regulator
MPNLLVVDDEPAILESLDYYLSSQGHQIQTASGMPQALELAEKNMPDAIVSDLLFDGGNGLQLREELNRRKAHYNPGFILMSGKATLPSALEAIKQGVDQFLLKPLNLEELSMALDTALQKRRKVNQDLKVKFQLAEQFYHDMSLPFNLLLPRLCMLLEGRQGTLNMAQIQSLSGQFDYLRNMLWVMKGFYPRLLEGQGPDLKRNTLDVNRLIADSLARLESDIYQRELSLEFKTADLSKIIVSRETAQCLVEIVLTRALTIAEKNSRLDMTWSQEGTLLMLKIQLMQSGPDSQHRNIGPLVQMAPMSLTCLELAGLSYDSESPAGPWRIGFNLEKN